MLDPGVWCTSGFEKTESAQHGLLAWQLRCGSGFSPGVRRQQYRFSRFHHWHIWHISGDEVSGNISDGFSHGFSHGFSQGFPKSHDPTMIPRSPWNLRGSFTPDLCCSNGGWSVCDSHPAPVVTMTRWTRWPWNARKFHHNSYRLQASTILII